MYRPGFFIPFGRWRTTRKNSCDEAIAVVVFYQNHLVRSLIVVAMYYQPLLVLIYSTVLLLSNGLGAFLSPPIYLTTYTARNWVSLVGIFLVGTILAWALARMAAQLIGFAEEKERDARQMAEGIQSMQGRVRSLVKSASQIGEELSQSTAQTATAVEFVASSAEPRVTKRFKGVLL